MARVEPPNVRLTFGLVYLTEEKKATGEPTALSEVIAVAQSFSYHPKISGEVWV